MTTTAASGSTSQQYPSYHYSDHSDDYVPRTSTWNSSLPCEYIRPSNTEAKEQCCSSLDTIDRAVDKAYRHGIQSHLGIKAIQDYPCVSEYEMGKLSNDLHDKIGEYGIRTKLPDGLEPTKRPLGVSKEILNYCKEVVFEKLARELDRVNDSKPIAFTKQVVKYCQYALTLRPSPIDTSTYINKGWD